jgi:hypothetical protein
MQTEYYRPSVPALTPATLAMVSCFGMALLRPFPATVWNGNVTEKYKPSVLFAPSFPDYGLGAADFYTLVRPLPQESGRAGFPVAMDEAPVRKEIAEALDLIDLSNALLVTSRPMTAWERKVTDEFFWSQFT